MCCKQNYAPLAVKIAASIGVSLLPLTGTWTECPLEAKVGLKQLAVTEAPLSDTMLQVKQQCVYY